MPRLMLTDEYWSKLLPIMKAAGIYDKAQLRRTVEGILYKLRVGCPWRDLPRFFGQWNSVYKRFNEWCRLEKMETVFNELAKEPGEVHDCKAAPKFIAALPQTEHVIADKGYDSDPLREQIITSGAFPVIPK